MARQLRSMWAEHLRAHRIETLFAVLAVCFGLLFVFATPPTQVADEMTHFHRAYQLSEGHVRSVKIEDGYGAILPTAVYDTSIKLYDNIPSHYERHFRYRMVGHFLKVTVKNNERVPVHLEGSTVYTPVPYMPQIFAIWTTRLVWPSPVLMYYVGRIANLLFWIVLLYCTLRLWPYGKWPIFVLALLPMSLTQAASFSPDALTNGLALVLIAMVLHARVHNLLLNKNDIALGIFAFVLLCLCKPIFLGLWLLIFLLRKEQFASIRERRWSLVLSLGIAMLLTALWNALVQKYSIAIVHYYYPMVHQNATDQLKYVLLHPFHFAVAVARTYFTSLSNVIVISFAGRLGMWDTDLPLLFVVGTYILLTVATLNRGKDGIPNCKVRLWSLMTFGVSILLMSGVLYLAITDVGGHYIYFMQGRYFIPFVPLLIAACYGVFKVERWDRLAAKFIPLSSAALLFVSLIVLINRFI